ncbi:MAG: phosphate ABC transporter permease subunit PstC [Candidatus Enteromonas sp.]|nr:phosphate ABC transporter permease subunit PstC [Candidatus Enteromonas sp.]
MVVFAEIKPKNPKWENAKEKGAQIGFLLCAVLSLGSLLLITVFLFASGMPFLARYGVGDFLFGSVWAPLATIPRYGILPMILTTFSLVALSSVFGAIIGLLVAIALFAFVPSGIQKPLKALIELLAGIPSVIFGLFGLMIVVPFVRDYVSVNGVGYGLLSSTVVLLMMILPTMVSVSYDSLKAVNPMYLEGALALGVKRSMGVFQIVVPAAKNGILAGIVLSTGRALGETMAVIMVIGGSPTYPTSLTQSVRTLTANIAMGANELSGEAKEALVCCGAVLFLFSFLLNLAFALLRKKGANRE